MVYLKRFLIVSFLILLFNPMHVKACSNSSGFDPIYYLSNNPDVAAAYGWNPQGALEHYVNFGMAEGRAGCATEAGDTEGVLSGLTVILDAGHGGRDPGCVRNGVYEKNVNFAIIMKIKALLESYGATVLLTRADDSFVSLE